MADCITSPFWWNPSSFAASWQWEKEAILRNKLPAVICFDQLTDKHRMVGPGVDSVGGKQRKTLTLEIITANMESRASDGIRVRK